jgi:hypothetical protein
MFLATHLPVASLGYLLTAGPPSQRTLRQTYAYSFLGNVDGGKRTHWFSGRDCQQVLSADIHVDIALAPYTHS